MEGREGREEEGGNGTEWGYEREKRKRRNGKGGKGKEWKGEGRIEGRVEDHTASISKPL